jgi:hypothetical protein
LLSFLFSRRIFVSVSSQIFTFAWRSLKTCLLFLV